MSCMVCLNITMKAKFLLFVYFLDNKASNVRNNNRRYYMFAVFLDRKHGLGCICQVVRFRQSKLNVANYA